MGEQPLQEHWPVAHGFVAGEIDGDIYCWGGAQKQPGATSISEYEYLPADVIHCFNPVNQSWREILASGDIPPASQGAAGVLCKVLLYLFAVKPDSAHSVTI